MSAWIEIRKGVMVVSAGRFGLGVLAVLDGLGLSHRSSVVVV